MCISCDRAALPRTFSDHFLAILLMHPPLISMAIVFLASSFSFVTSCNVCLASVTEIRERFSSSEILSMSLSTHVRKISHTWFTSSPFRFPCEVEVEQSPKGKDSYSALHMRLLFYQLSVICYSCLFLPVIAADSCHSDLDN